MAIARISAQDASATGTNGAVATYPTTATNNNLLVAIGVSDTGAGTMAIAGFTQVLNNFTSGNQISIFYKVSAGTETTITMTDDGGSTVNALAIFEYSGLSTTPLDKFASAGDNITSTLSVASGTTATTTNSDELLIAAAFWENALQTFSSATNSFTNILNVGSRLFVVERIVASTGAYSTTITVTGTAGSALGAIATFAAPAVPKYRQIVTNINGGAKLRPAIFVPGLAR